MCGWGSSSAQGTGGRVRAPAPTAYPKVRLIFCRARCPHRAVPGRPRCAAPTAKTNRSYNRDRSPHPPRFARHLPLKGKACGRPLRSPLHKKQTGSVGSAESGAAVEPHQHQFWECQVPVARREYRLPLRFCAPKLLQYFQVRVPRNGGPGVSGPMDLGGAKRSRSPSVASPGDPLVTFPSMGK